MSAIEWYYARGNKQMGPVSAAELKRLAVAGELRPDDLVWREGLAEWTSARNVRGLFDEENHPAAAADTPSKAVATLAKDAEPAEPPAAPTVAAGPRAPTRHLFDVLFDIARPHFNAHFVETTAKLFRACGLYGLLAAMVLVAAFDLIVSVKTHDLGPLSGLILLLVFAILQHTAGRFCDAIEQLNTTTSGNISTTALPDCFALLSLLAGVVGLLGSVFMAPAISFPVLLFGIVLFVICVYLAVVAMNPATLGISITPELRAGEEAIGILTFLLKALLRLTPVAFGIGVVYGVLMIGYACCDAIFAGDNMSTAMITASNASKALLCSAALPLAAYLLFLLGSLSLDLCRAILILPGKLDKSRENDEENREQ